MSDKKLSILRHTAGDLVRLYAHTERAWLAVLGGSTPLEGGLAITAPDLRRVPEANCMLEAAIPTGATAEEVVVEAEAHFSSIGLVCQRWEPAAWATPLSVTPLMDHLSALGWTERLNRLMRLGDARTQSPALPEGISFLPERAALRQAETLARIAAAERGNEPQRAEAYMRHLDDPHVESIVALADRQAIGRIAILAMGEVGRIDELYVKPESRRQGIGQALIAHAILSCIRSQFRHVLLAVKANQVGAARLFERSGFCAVGQFKSYTL